MIVINGSTEEVQIESCRLRNLVCPIASRRLILWQGGIGEWHERLSIAVQKSAMVDTFAILGWCRLVML